jgi:hypothetical protein
MDSTALRVTDALDRQWDNPSPEVIWDLVSGLTPPDNDFMIVEHLPDTSAGGTYIQTAILEDGCYTVEYQDGDVEHHFHADVDGARQAYEVILAWASERPGWREMLAWEQETFS